MTQPPVSDPKEVQETICDGQFNVTTHGPLATITFTHARPKLQPLFAEGKIEPEFIVRARITVSRELLVQLGQAINSLVNQQTASATAAGGGQVH